MLPFLLVYLKVLLEEALEICRRKHEFCVFDLNAHTLLTMPFILSLSYIL